MSEEEFIIKFYSCDNEEQFLKDVYSNMKNSNQKLKELKERIDNAIELLEHIPEIPNNYLELKRTNLLDILKEDK